MDKSKRKELQEAYKEIKTYMGVIQITNTVNGKTYVGGYPNLKNKWSTIQAQLAMGQFPNLELQKDWHAQGGAGFEYEVLEQQDAGEITDIKWAKKQLEKGWLQKLQPYDDKGYNKPPKE
ncbi:GIY-YIG nuclease family protein [Paenibacillus sp. strain BS8-2]